MPARALRQIALLVLAIAAVAVLARVHGFGQERFFTIDEYQYGHATWLVSQGQRPYVDFYEHHFPLSYVAHAPLLPETGSFARRALLLRRITSAYLIALAAVLALATRVVTGDVAAALLSACLPFAFGFSLMSAVEYRADNFAACLLLACLALLEANRSLRRRSLALGCGVLAAAALLMTQKMLVLAGGTLALYGILDAIGRRTAADRLLVFPGRFVAAAAAVLAAAIAAAFGLGLLPAAFEITILQAIRHEAIYPPDSVWQFAGPFFAETAFTTTPILLFAAVYLVLARSLFWAVPLCVALVAGGLIAGQYPYNYVFLGLMLVACSARGYARVVQRWQPASLRLQVLRPLLVLLPLAVLPDQLDFVANRTSNAHQLDILDKIERYTSADDVVIDGAGGALFRPHASYYWYHGFAHREIFADYFAANLVDDYRRSRAPLWLEDGRLHQLPQAVVEYFRSHYVRADGSLHALGFLTPETSPRERLAIELDVVRAGDYTLLPVGRPLAGGEVGGLEIDGRVVRGGAVPLAEGLHRVTVRQNSPRFILSLLPAAFFRDNVSGGRDHALLFEYE